MPLSVETRTKLHKIVGLWDDLVDSRVGIIQQIEDLPVDDDDPEFFHYYSKACDTSRFALMSNFSENGGASVERHIAVAKAMGEAVERYCSAIYDPAEFLLSSYRDIHVPAVDPGLLSVYREDQYAWKGFPWQPFRKDTQVYWTPCFSLVDGEEILAPAACVYIPFHFRGITKSPYILQPISTGMACGTTYEEAALSGLCEVLERDAFTITWQARLSRPLIRLESLPRFGQDLVARFNAVGIDVKLVDMTNDIGVASIMSIALSKTSTSPAVAVSAATDASPEVALRKSLEELAHTRKYARQLLIYSPPVPIDPDGLYPDVKDQRGHLRFYCPQEAKEFASFAWESDERTDLRDLPDLSAGDATEQLQAVVRKAAAAGLNPLAREMTTPDIAELGLRVVRVFAPGAHPLYMGHINRALGVPRLYETPRKLGHRGMSPNDMDNPYPHPFP